MCNRAKHCLLTSILAGALWAAGCSCSAWRGDESSTRGPGDASCLQRGPDMSGWRSEPAPASGGLLLPELAALPDLNSGCYKVSAYISAAIRLQDMGRELACRALLQAAQTDRMNRQIVVLCRILFIKRGAGEFRRPWIGQAIFLGSTDYPDWPLEPVECVDGVPFLITRGYIVFGWPEPAESYLRHCMASCDWNTARMREPTDAEKGAALGKLLASKKWRRPLDAEERRFLSAQIREEGSELEEFLWRVIDALAG